MQGKIDVMCRNGKFNMVFNFDEVTREKQNPETQKLSLNTHSIDLNDFYGSVEEYNPEKKRKSR